MSELILYLWNLTLSILKAMSEVWDWLRTPQTVGKFEIFGLTFFEGVTFTPLVFGGGLILLILALGLVSLFNPFN